MASIFRAPLVQRIIAKSALVAVLACAAPNLLGTTLKGQDKQFAAAGQFKVYDYPNPRGAAFPTDLRTFINPIETQLIGKDKFFAGPGMGPDYDWPNPVLRKPNLELYTFLDPTEYWLLKDKLFGAAGEVQAIDAPNPLHPVSRAHLQQALERPLLTTTLALAPVPVVPPDFANPRGAAFPVDLRTFLDGRKPFHVDSMAFSQQDWANPSRGARPALQPYHYRPTSAVPTTPVVTLPFGLSEWPNPRSPFFSNELRSFLDGRKPYHVDSMAFSQNDWLNPRGPRAALLERWDQNLLQSTLAPIIASPFFQSQWTVPSSAIYPVSLRTWLSERKQFYADALPFSQNEWANPKGRIHLAGTFEISRLENLLAPVSASPFFQSEWPNPSRIVSPVTNRTFVFYYVYDETVPFTPQEWVNPRGPQPTLLRGFIETRREYIVPILGANPFGQSEWPNPKGAQYPIILRSFTDGRKTYYVDAMAFRQAEWPVPKGAPYPSHLRFFALDAQSGALIPTPPPPPGVGLAESGLSAINGWPMMIPWWRL